MQRSVILKSIETALVIGIVMLIMGSHQSNANAIEGTATAMATMAATTAPVSGPVVTGNCASSAAFMVATLSATDAAVQATQAAVTYNGGQLGTSNNLSGKPIKLVDVPKGTGIGYFAATAKGEQEAAQELGNVSVKTDGPAAPDIAQQNVTIDNYISQNVDGVLFSANDPIANSPVLRKALKQGIHVIGYDADAQPNAREWFVNQASFEGIAQTLVDCMVAEVGSDADVAIVTTSLKAPNQTRWIAEMQKYIAAQSLKLNIVEILPSQEDQDLASQATQNLLTSYPNIKGIWGLSSVVFPGVAQAITSANKCGKIAIIGLSTPNTMRPFVKSGCVKSVVLWNPVDLGYAAVYAMRAVVDGALKPDATEVAAGRLGKLKIVNGSEILLGAPFIFDANNIDAFDF